MKRFAAVYDAIDSTTSTNAKVAAMVAYFKEAPAADAAWAVFFLTGRRLKRLVSHVAIHEWTLAATGLEPWLLEESYAVVGDGAETAALVLDQVAVVSSEDVPLSEWVEGRILPLREQCSKEDCGACDYCLGELETVADPIVVARKVLSCVARVGQRFGVAHVANVLCGSDTDQITSRRHHQLTTFGLLRGSTTAEVRGCIEQLIAHGFLRQTDDAFPVVTLTDRGVELMKDPMTHPDLVLARQRRPVKGRVEKRAKIESESWKDVDRDLFERLRGVRLQIARTRGVPPYVIFHDTTLREMARIRPTTIDELHGIRGIGARKAEDLGETFLAAIRGSAAGS